MSTADTTTAVATPAARRDQRGPQAGILNRPPDNLLIAAFDFVPTDPASARAALEALREVVKDELKSNIEQLDPQAAVDQPTAETGELGFDDGYDRYHLTITVGFAATAYDKLQVSAANRPSDLDPLDWSKLGDTPQQPATGDVVLQLCGDSIYILEHVVRRIEHQLAGQFALIWTLSGAQRHNSRSGRVSRDEGRALIGFLDGTANLDPKNNANDAGLVFVGPDMPPYPPVPPNGVDSYGQPTGPNFPPDLRQPPAPEPESSDHGTYMVVRASVLDISHWDTSTLGDQQHAIGRFKLSGSGLQAPNDPSVPPVDPDYSTDPGGTITPLTAHVRKANPRTPDDLNRRIYRRGYPLVLPTTQGLSRGLVFICFGRSLSTQFEFITRAWLTNPDFPTPGAGVDALRGFETAVIAGGWYFVPPLEHKTQPWTWLMPQ